MKNASRSLNREAFWHPAAAGIVAATIEDGTQLQNR